MSVVFLLLWFISLILLVLGLISPGLIKPLIRRKLTRKQSGLLFGGLAIVFLLLMVATVSPEQLQTKPSQTAVPVASVSGTKQPPTPAESPKISPINIADSTNHPPATGISGLAEGWNAVWINASISTTAKGVTFTNNEKQQWDGCIATINPESGMSNWFEYDFGSIPEGKPFFISWDQLKRIRFSDNGTTTTPYAYVASESKMIELSCELDKKTLGFARFQSIGTSNQVVEPAPPSAPVKQPDFTVENVIVKRVTKDGCRYFFSVANHTDTDFTGSVSIGLHRKDNAWPDGGGDWDVKVSAHLHQPLQYFDADRCPNTIEKGGIATYGYSISQGDKEVAKGDGEITSEFEDLTH